MNADSISRDFNLNTKQREGERERCSRRRQTCSRNALANKNRSIRRSINVTLATATAIDARPIIIITNVALSGTLSRSILALTKKPVRQWHFQFAFINTGRDRQGRREPILPGSDSIGSAKSRENHRPVANDRFHFSTARFATLHLRAMQIRARMQTEERNEEREREISLAARNRVR